MLVLGKATEKNALAFCEDHACVSLGSATNDGLRRVVSYERGEALEAHRKAFQEIAVGPKRLLSTLPEPPHPCIHRGSQRHTCCGSPSLWICRLHKTDCTATDADKSKLQSMVSTNVDGQVRSCSSCSDWPARVGFLSTAYLPIGGTETFHRTLLPCLNGSVDVKGFVTTGKAGGDGLKVGVPYSTGIDAAKKLVLQCDTVVTWGIGELHKILPRKRPRVVAVHHSDSSSGWGNDTILRQLSLIDEIVCVNQHTAEHLKDCGKPVHYIPNAIDPRRIQPSGNQSALRAHHGIPEDSKIVLFGHRLSEEKRPLLALDIAKHLPPDWTMVVAGDGPEAEKVRKAAHDRVRIVGAVDSLADWLAVSDCFLSLSTFEGFGLSIGEAMAAGVPTVSTPTGIASGLATTLPTNSALQEWAQAIVSAKVIVQPEVILERCSVQRMVDAWANVIRGIK